MRSPRCPLLVLVLVLVLLQSIGGQTPETQPASSDTLQRVPNPRTALLLGLIPGGGQIYNRAWLKSILVIAAQGYYAYQFQQSRDHYNHYEPSLPHSQNYYLDMRNKYAWRSLLVYLLGMMDAYVDAHLSTFPPDTTQLARLPSNHPIEERP
ncbi:MAG: DUF5683 domain-containing protein [Candidatus Neomarinimicrobiota bacterium]